MKNKCFDIGMIQAFLDGELASDLSEKLVKHTAVCDACALMMSEAEEENAFAFAALDGEFNVLVPTERLRTKLFTAIDEIEKERSIGWWQRLTENFAFLGDIDLRSPSVVALACTLLFVGTFAFAMKFFPVMGDFREVVVLEPEMDPVDFNTDIDKVGNSGSTSDDTDEVDEPEAAIKPVRRRPVSYISRTNNRTSKARKSGRRKPVRVIKANNTEPVVKPIKAVRTGPAVEGEDIYLQTISALNKTVDEGKDFTMGAKDRIAFERNIAMVDNAISKMKAEVRKNPKNKAARELLKSSYQNKIDLLNSVSERNELMASMQ